MGKSGYGAVILGALAGLLLVAFLIFGFQVTIPEHAFTISKTPDASDELAQALEAFKNRKIIDSHTQSNDVVAYTYVGEKIPPHITKDEVPELRTENSYTRYIETVKPGDNPTVKLTSIFYPRPQFVEDSDGEWRAIEYATTSVQAWNMRPRPLAERIRDLVLPTAYAVSLTVYSGGGDGQVQGTGGATDANQNTCLTNAWTNRLNSGSPEYLLTSFGVDSSISSFNEPPWSCSSTVDRGFAPFLTDAIPSGSTITAATLGLYVLSKSDGDIDAQDYISAFVGMQASETSLTAADITTAGSEVIDSGERKDLATISTSAYLIFTLNATGLANVKTSGQASACGVTAGYSCFVFLEGHDAEGTVIADGASNGISVSSSETGGTSQDPYLSVTYTVAAAALALGPTFSVGANGQFEVGNDGNLQIGEW